MLPLYAFIFEKTSQLIEEIVDVVDLFGAAQVLVVGIGSRCALGGGSFGARAVHLDAQDVGSSVIAGHEEGLVGLAGHGIGRDCTAYFRVPVRHQDGEVTDGRTLVVRGVGVNVGLLCVDCFAVPHIDAPLYVMGHVEGTVPAHPGQVLTGPVESVSVVASIVAHGAALHIEGG